ncbi:MAG TPA: ABC transporter permease [Candidatus Acidoferrales bacterium]|nr:ABC transporter permease [Candidatus Acidoferrales bacterium]
MNNFWQDFRFGTRTLAKNPGFAVVAILTLALGIGASTSIFSVVDAVLLRPLPYPHPQQLVAVYEREGGGQRSHLADPNLFDFRSQNHTLTALAMFSSGPDAISGGSEPVRVNIGIVSQGFFKALGVEPFRGRAFAPNEHVVHGAAAMIVSYNYWRDFLGSASDLPNVHLTMDGTVFPVVGVMPQGFDFPAGVSAWVSFERYGLNTSRTSHDGEGIGRVRDGVTVEQARADLETIARRIHEQYGKGENPNFFISDAVVIPLSDDIVGKVRPALLTLFAAVIVLFLVACANVAGLMLARTSARRKELAVRAALGAGRGRLVQQLLAESLVLAVAGGVLGIFLALWTTDLLPAILPANLPRQQGITVNGTVLFFTVAATLTVAIGLGLFTAWRAGNVDLNDALSAGSRSYSGGSPKARSVLVIGEIAATVMLLVGAGLLGRSFLDLLSVNSGFNAQNLLVAKFSLPLSESAQNFGMSQAETVRQTQFLEQALARIRSIPGIQSAGVTGDLPISGENNFPDGLFVILNGQSLPTNIDELKRALNRMWQNPKQTGTADYAVASGEFFRAAEIPIIRGRLFNAQDGPDSPNVAVITQTLAREKWRHQSPIGQQIFFGNMDGITKPLTIVGVVGDIRAEGLEQPPSPVIFVDYRQRGFGENSSPAIILRAASSPSAIVPSVRAIFRQLNPNIPVEFTTFAEVLGGWTAQKRFLMLLAGVFAGAALLLAAVGIYGLVANSVVQRTQEIGIRMALGAQRSDVLRLVVGEAARLAVMGLLIGIALSFAATQLISSLLYGVKATDPLTFVIVAVILSAVALLASYIPARCAMRLDPMIALRYE